MLVSFLSPLSIPTARLRGIHHSRSRGTVLDVIGGAGVLLSCILAWDGPCPLDHKRWALGEGTRIGGGEDFLEGRRCVVSIAIGQCRTEGW
jgi:hypothetical protein